jgi:tetratricopeptide (TPR) repeat protein
VANVQPDHPDNVGASRNGRVLAVQQGDQAIVLDRDRPSWRAMLGPQYDLRNTAVSPDGRWVVTCSFFWDGRSKSTRIWEAETGRHVRDLPLEGATSAGFSPDGRWLATNSDRCRLWEVGPWREGPHFDPAHFAFSPDGRLLALDDVVGVIRLVQPDTGREVARLTGPEPTWYQPACFSPDGTRLVALRKDQSALYVWDLRLIRRQLRELHLDWDWPPFPPSQGPEDGGPARVEVDLGPQGAAVVGSPAQQVGLNSMLVALNPFNHLAYLQRAWAYSQLGEPRKAVADLNLALALAGEYHSLRSDRDTVMFALADMATLCNNLAWALVTEPEKRRDPLAALPLIQKAVALAPGSATYWNTLGVVYYRLGRDGQAVEALERSLSLGRGDFAAFDLYVLALCHARLGQADKARDCYDRAAQWVREQHGKLDAKQQAELDAFHVEAEAVLAQPTRPIPPTRPRDGLPKR